MFGQIVLTLLALHICNGFEIFKEVYDVEFEQIDLKENADPVSAKCMDCICQVESHCQNIGCRMDVGSLSCGPFQIKKPYWQDCGSPGADYQSCTTDYRCSYNCVQAYMRRYIGGSGCPRNCESYARIHNGGPRGCTNPNTLGYWNKITSKGCTPDS